jgi:hypothetical protein
VFGLLKGRGDAWALELHQDLAVLALGVVADLVHGARSDLRVLDESVVEF